jgi:hypothetical protein
MGDQGVIAGDKDAGREGDGLDEAVAGSLVGTAFV